MTSVQHLSTTSSCQRRRPPGKLLFVAGLATLAEWLFYGQTIGVSFVLFIAATAAVGLFADDHVAGWRTVARIAVALGLSLLPFLEAPGLLAGVFGAMGLALSLIVFRADDRAPSSEWLSRSLLLLVSGPLRCSQDLLQIWRLTSGGTSWASLIGRLAIWVVPTLVFTVFLGLFASANPVFGDVLSRVDLWPLLAYVSIPRTLFWMAVCVAIWPFVLVRRNRVTTLAPMPAVVQSEADAATTSLIFGPAALLRSFLVCNVLFAAQTATDVAYLWFGVTLPDGLTYASYAHRGAYLLILTALLAAAFVVTAMRPGSAAARSRSIRLLVYAWVVQNILLVISSALRLDLYVQVYSLTCWRAAAFIWMALVAMGLVAVIVQIARDRSIAWLSSTATWLLLATLYLCCFVDFPRLIATYNVAHCREVTGDGAWLDQVYLVSLGPGVISALDGFHARYGDGAEARQALFYFVARRRLVAEATVDDWRAWNFRDWRLQRELRRGSAPEQ